MPVTTIAVTGVIVDPSSGPRVGAPVAAELVSNDTPVIGYDSTEEIVGVAQTSADNTGTWTLNLIPNIDITPANTVYKVTVGGSYVTYITVPSSGGPYNINNLLVTPPSAADPLGIQISHSGALVATRPELNFTGSVTVTDDPTGGRVDVNITGGSGTNAFGTLFNVEDYGAVADGTTDNYTAFNNAWNDMVAAGGGKLFLPTAGIYRVVVDSRVQHFTDGQYCVFPIPLLASNNTTKKEAFGIIGVGEAYVTRNWAGFGQTTALNNTSSTILVDYTTSFAWNSSFGHPSFIGAHDVDKAGSAWTNVHFSIEHVTMRQPDNPSLCGLNLENCSTAYINDFAADVNVFLDNSSEPTHPTGVPVMLPKPGNAVNVAVEKFMSWGYYGGYPITEHSDGKSIETIACKIAAFTRRAATNHCCQISWWSLEECPWGIAGLDPTSGGPNGGVIQPAGWVIQALFVDIEDFDRAGAAPWMYPGATGAKKAFIYDPGNSLRGWCWMQRTDSGAELNSDTGSVYVTGATNFGIYKISSRDAAATRLTGGSPPADTVPNAPTIGTATAGNASASVAFTPAVTGSPATSFTATSTPGSHTGTAASSPITVSGLTNGTSYTFTVHATNGVGNSAESASSNSVTPSGSGTTYVSDTFTRANASLGGSSPETGANPWVDNSVSPGVWQVVSNQAHYNSGGTGGQYSPVVIDTGHADGTVTVRATPSGDSDQSLVVRYVDNNNFIMLDLSGGNTGGWVCRGFQRIGGTFTGMTSLINLTGYTTAHTLDLKIVKAGATITMSYSIDSGSFQSVGSFSCDASLQASTKDGLVAETGAISANFDNFLVTS